MVEVLARIKSLIAPDDRLGYEEQTAMLSHRKRRVSLCPSSSLSIPKLTRDDVLRHGDGVVDACISGEFDKRCSDNVRCDIRDDVEADAFHEKHRVFKILE